MMRKREVPSKGPQESLVLENCKRENETIRSKRDGKRERGRKIKIMSSFEKGKDSKRVVNLLSGAKMFKGRKRTNRKD